MIHSTLLKCRVAVVRGVRCASAVLSFASNVAPNFLSTASNSPLLPLFLWVEFYRTSRRYRGHVPCRWAAGFYPSELETFAKFRPVLLLLLLTVLDSFFCFFLLPSPPRNQSEEPMPRGENMVRAARAAQPQRQNE